MSQLTVIVFPHSPGEFPGKVSSVTYDSQTTKFLPTKELNGAEQLKEWIITELKEGKGLYRVPESAFRSPYKKALYNKALPGAIVLLMKDRKLAGEGIVEEAFRILTDEDKRYFQSIGEPPRNPEGKLYEGVITFEPSSLRGYSKMLDLDALRSLTGESISYQFGGEFKKLDSYVKLVSEIGKTGFC